MPPQISTTLPCALPGPPSSLTAYSPAARPISALSPPNAPDVQVPVVRREKEPQPRDGHDDDDRERRVQAPVAAADEEQERREQEVEPFLDREAPGDRIEIDLVGRAEQIFDIK